MNKAATLEKVIRKAIDRGWKPGWQDRRPVVSWDVDYSADFDEGEGVMIIGYHAKSNASRWFFPLRELIYNHDFAKALWGVDAWVHRCDTTTVEGEEVARPYCSLPLWEYHLQAMVTSPDPLKYLQENMPE